ncbi:MAG TPA: hypothetical protein VGK24_02145 [Candidatus Angelobacter sp.]|jgi:hypothetical protein
MNRYISIVFLSLAAAGLNAKNHEPCITEFGSAGTQATTQPGDPDITGSFRPGAGTVIVIELVKSIDIRKVKVGDQVEGSVLQDLAYKGKVIIPHDAKIVGHVTEATPATKEQPQSRLGLVFEKIVLKNKKELPMQYPAAVAALAPPIQIRSTTTTQTSDMPIQMEKGRSSGGAAIDAVNANSNLAGANMRAMGSGGLSAADHGVIRMKHLTLETTDGGMTTIVSDKGDIKLESAVQMVVRVMDPPKGHS